MSRAEFASKASSAEQANEKRANGRASGPVPTSGFLVDLADNVAMAEVVNMVVITWVAKDVATEVAISGCI